MGQYWTEQDKKIEEAISGIPDEPSRIDIIADIRGWFRPEKDSAFYPDMQSYLSGTTDLAQTIQLMTEPIDALSIANRFRKVNTLDLWYSFFHSAKRIPFRNVDGHTKLIKLLLVFKSHPEDDTTQSPRKDKDGGGLGFYQSAKDLGMATRETMNDCPGVGAGYFAEEMNAWTNLNYFFARLIYYATEPETDEQAIGSLFWIECIFAMREGLEEVLKDDGPNDAHKPGTARQKYDARVPAAAVWVFALGKKMYEKEEDLTPPSPNQGKPGRGGALWKGPPEFSKARWALWKKRFQEISEMEEVSKETRHIAKDAYDAMNGCES
jgi:hypothetical protein